MIRRDLTIANKLGLHARAAAKLVQCAGRFGSRIEIERRGQQVNGKSIMGIMMLAASQGSSVTVTVEGDDETAAMDAVTALFEGKFGEPE